MKKNDKKYHISHLFPFFLSKIFFCSMTIMIACNAAGIDLTFLSIKPAYKIYFCQKRRLSEKLYFFPCSDNVLVISIGKIPVFGQGCAAIRCMQQKARIKAQNELESFIAAQVSAKEKTFSQNGKTIFFSSFSQTISREISVWEVIGPGFSSDRKSFCCIIGKVFPKKLIPPSFFD